MSLSPNELRVYENQAMTLRVFELQSVLTVTNVSRMGKKNELIQRVIDMLRNPRFQAQVVQKIKEVKAQSAQAQQMTNSLMANQMQQQHQHHHHLYQPYYNQQQRQIRSSNVRMSNYNEEIMRRYMEAAGQHFPPPLLPFAMIPIGHQQPVPPPRPQPFFAAAMQHPPYYPAAQQQQQQQQQHCDIPRHTVMPQPSATTNYFNGPMAAIYGVMMNGMPTGVAPGVAHGVGAAQTSVPIAQQPAYVATAPLPSGLLRPISLPFFDEDVQGTRILVLAPHSLPSAPNPSVPVKQRVALNFVIPSKLAAGLTYNESVTHPPRYEVQLRFFNISSNEPVVLEGRHLDDFPPSCSVRIDDTNVALPAVIPTNRPNQEAKRPPRPVNVTQYCQPPRENNVKPHRLVIEWQGDRRTYAVTVQIVYRLTADILKGRIMERPRRAFDETKGMLSKMRMQLPARGQRCTHLQCFDLSTYLQMNEKRPTWKCGVCGRPALYQELHIDDYFSKLIAEAPATVNEMELFKDGTFSAVKHETADVSDSDDDTARAPPAKKPSVQQQSLGGTSTSSAASSTQASGTSGNPAATTTTSHAKKSGAATAVDVIVLSDSDDDDDNNDEKGDNVKASAVASTTIKATESAPVFQQVQQSTTTTTIPRVASVSATMSEHAMTPIFSEMHGSEGPSSQRPPASNASSTTRQIEVITLDDGDDSDDAVCMETATRTSAIPEKKYAQSQQQQVRGPAPNLAAALDWSTTTTTTTSTSTPTPTQRHQSTDGSSSGNANSTMAMLMAVAAAGSGSGGGGGGGGVTATSAASGYPWTNSQPQNGGQASNGYAFQQQGTTSAASALTSTQVIQHDLNEFITKINGGAVTMQQQQQQQQLGNPTMMMLNEGWSQVLASYQSDQQRQQQQNLRK